MAYELIETIEVGAGGASSIEFTGIDQTGQDLVCLVSLRSNRTAQSDVLGVRLNGSSANRNYILLKGSGSAATSESGAEYRMGYINGGSSTSNTFSSGSIYISNYASSQNKSLSGDVVSENNGSEAYQSLVASSWSQTAAITSVRVQSYTGSDFVQHSTASLYKVTAD